MAEYEFRLRFDLAPTQRIDSEAETVELFALPTGFPVRLTRVTTKSIKEGPSVAVMGRGYDSEDAARAAAQKMKAALLYLAVHHHLGIDFGDGHPRFWMGKHVHEHFAERGISSHNDVLGIDVYERKEPQVFFAGGVQAGVLIDIGNLVKILEPQFLGSHEYSAKQTLSCEIYSSSFFDTSSRSRFLTLMTAVEALLELAKRSEEAQELVEDMEALVQRSGVDEHTQRSLVSSLKWLRLESIRQTGKKLAAALLPDRQYGGHTAPDFFIRSYDLRSQIVHQGSPDDPSINMLTAAGALEGFVHDLLLASLQQSFKSAP